MTYAIIVIKQVRLFVLGVMEQGGKVSLQIQVISMEEETLLHFMKIPLLEILLAIQTFTLNVILVEVCPRCHGSKGTWEDTGYYTGSNTKSWINCPACNGSGKCSICFGRGKL